MAFIHVLKQSFLFLQVWQHCDCMRLETEVEHYLCEQCDLRPVDRVCVLSAFVQNGSPCPVCGVHAVLVGISHHANRLFNLTLCCFC